MGPRRRRRGAVVVSRRRHRRDTRSLRRGREKPSPRSVPRRRPFRTGIGINIEGDVDLGLFSGWLEVLLRDKGADLFRIKGVLAVKGVPDKYVYHAVRGSEL